MPIIKFALSKIKMYDKIDILTDALADLRRFVESHVSERDYLGLGYASRERFVNDVLDAIVYLHLHNDSKLKTFLPSSKFKMFSSDDNTLTTRRIVSLEQYKCKNCGTLNNFCRVDDNDDDENNKPSRFKEKLYKEKDKKDYSEDNDDDDNDDDDKEEEKDIKHARRNAIIFISKWTIFKIVTELFLWARCWFWGYCERPWYILWNRKNKILYK